MTVCYAQLRLKGLSDYTNFSFTAQFISQDTGRKFETSKLKIHATGISVEASFQLQKNENAKTVVYDLMYFYLLEDCLNLDHLWA